MNLVERIRMAPIGLTTKEAAIKLVEEKRAKAEDAFLALAAARILDRPVCQKCHRTIPQADVLAFQAETRTDEKPEWCDDCAEME